MIWITVPYGYPLFLIQTAPLGLTHKQLITVMATACGLVQQSYALSDRRLTLATTDTWLSTEGQKQLNDKVIRSHRPSPPLNGHH